MCRTSLFMSGSMLGISHLQPPLIQIESYKASFLISIILQLRHLGRLEFKSRSSDSTVVLFTIFCLGEWEVVYSFVPSFSKHF